MVRSRRQVVNEFSEIMRTIAAESTALNMLKLNQKMIQSSLRFPKK